MRHYDLVRDFVSRSFDGNTRHFDRTVEWVKKLKPEADEALLVAAMAHDIERAHRTTDRFDDHEFDSREFLDHHQKDGADIIAKYLKEHGAEHDFVERVRHLVSAHEYGGDEDQDILKDADSISFFECNAEFFIDKKVKEVGKDMVKRKFDWMFNRITSEKAKEIARPWYEKYAGELS